MKIVSLPLGDYQTNTYILYVEGNDKCLIVDPGFEAFHILRHVNSLGLEVEAILLTHGHFDHVGAVRTLVADTDCAVYMNDRENTMPEMMTARAVPAAEAPQPARRERRSPAAEWEAARNGQLQDYNPYTGTMPVAAGSYASFGGYGM